MRSLAISCVLLSLVLSGCKALKRSENISFEHYMIPVMVEWEVQGRLLPNPIERWRMKFAGIRENPLLKPQEAESFIQWVKRLREEKGLPPLPLE